MPNTKESKRIPGFISERNNFALLELGVGLEP